MKFRLAVASIIALVVTSLVLSSCGIRADRYPREVDPQKQEELNTP